MDKLTQLSNLCKHSVSVYFNWHRDNYDSVIQDLQRKSGMTDVNDIITELDIPIGVFNEMIKLDTVVDICFYPKNAVGSYNVYHYDINKALDICFEILNK